MGRFLVVLAVTAGFVGFAACSGSDGDAGARGTDGGGAGQSDAGDGSSPSPLDGGADDSATDAPEDSTGADTSVSKPFTLTSIAISDNALIPPTYTCNGVNQSPPLAWADPPDGTKSFAVVVRDIDAPSATDNYHWVIYDIDATNTGLAANVAAVALPPSPQGAKQTYWSFGNDYSYRGPCPPAGVHRYVFTVYALPDALLPGGPSTSPNVIDSAIQARKIGSATFTGKYTQ